MNRGDVICVYLLRCMGTGHQAYDMRNAAPGGSALSVNVVRPPSDESAHRDEPSALKILLVEDEGITGEDVQQCLSSLGYCVVGWASQGHQAIALAEQLRPDLILMDVGLQGEMDGIQA